GPVRHAVDRIVDFDGRLEPGPAHGTAEDQAAPDRPEVALEVEDVGSRARSDRGAAEPPASTVDVAHGGDGEGSPGADDPGCEAERLGPVGVGPGVVDAEPLGAAVDDPPSDAMGEAESGRAGQPAAFRG